MTASAGSHPKVSVLVSAYNHEDYIEACLLSILEQTYKNIELIVIDDGSHDNTYTIIRKLADTYGFYAEQQTNQGLTRTLNKMLAMATGKYICQFGSDDIMLPDKTARQVVFMESHPDVAVCGGNALNIDSHGMITNQRQRFPPLREITFEKLFIREREAGIVASTNMIRKDALDKVGGWDPSIPLEDISLWFAFTSRGYRMVGLNDVLMYYRKHQTNTYKNVRYMYESMMKTIAPYAGHPLYPVVRMKLLRSYFVNAAKHDKALAKEILKKIPMSHYDHKIIRGLLLYFFR